VFPGEDFIRLSGYANRRNVRIWVCNISLAVFGGKTDNPKPYNNYQRDALNIIYS